MDGRETKKQTRGSGCGMREGLAAYVIRGEKTELKARYHLSSGKWYSDAPVVFHVSGFYNARYYSPLFFLPRATPLAATLPPATLPPTLSTGCGLHSAAFTSVLPSTYTSETDVLQNPSAPSPPPFPSLNPRHPRAKPLALIIVSEPPRSLQ